ncbi:MAG: hypothetical protein HQM13_11160 [SAR324 cluster bacterium]|nr:hypothetical protein [SAR324 cluster bacterium]
MIAGEKYPSKWRQVIGTSAICLMLALVGCSQPRVRAYHAPTTFEIENPESLSDTELQTISRCDYWNVCIFEQHEEVAPFGPTFLYQERHKYVPREYCRFETCDRLKAFYFKPKKGM